MDMKDVLKNASLESQGHAGSIQNFDALVDETLTTGKSKYRIELDVRTIFAAFAALVLIALAGIFFTINAGSSNSAGSSSSSQVVVSKSASKPSEQDLSTSDGSANQDANQGTVSESAAAENVQAPASTAPVETAVDANGVVNLNLATLEDLQILKGVGPSTAQKILDYRQEHKRFSAKDELMQVKGIGQATFDKLKDKIRI